MNDEAVNWQYSTRVVAEAGASDRATFIRKTYAHLLGALVAFAVLEAIILNSSIAPLLLTFLTSGKFAWLIFMAAFIGVSYLAESMAKSNQSSSMQYVGLSLYVLVEALIFAPLLYILLAFYGAAGAQILISASVVTALITGGLTLFVFVTGKDFSFLRSALALGGLVAIGLIVGSMICGFQLGLFFIVGMITFACGHILYDTSNVLHHYRIGQHVAASLSLFASVMLLFWYVIRLLMELNRE